AAGLAGRDKDILGPGFRKEIFHLTGHGKVGFVRRHADEVFVAGFLKPFEERGPQKRIAAGNVDARAVVHGASMEVCCKAGSQPACASSRKVMAGWERRAFSASW